MLLSESVWEQHEQGCPVREDRKGPEGAISPAVPTIPGTLEAGIVFKLKPGLGTPEGAGGDSS